VIMGGHEAVSQNVHVLVQILFDVLQEVEIVLPLEEDCLTVIAAVVEVIILVGEERRFAAGHTGLLAPLDFRSAKERRTSEVGISTWHFYAS